MNQTELSPVDDLVDDDERSPIHAGEDDDESVTESIEHPKHPRARAKKKSKKAKKSASSAPKVDPEQAMAFVRWRAREEKDPLVKAFYERELATLQQTVKKAEEQRRANLTFPVNGGSAKIGSHVFEVTGAGRYGGGKPALVEYVVTSIFDQKETYGTRITKVANLRRERGKGERRVESGYHSGNLYLNPRAAVDRALNEAKRDLAKAERTHQSMRAKHDALEEIRAKAPACPPPPTPLDALRKTKTTVRTRKAKAPTSGRVASNSRAGKRWTEEENATLKSLVAEGKTPEAIAAEIGRPRDRVVRQMHRLGIKSASTPFHNFHAERDGAADSATDVEENQIPEPGEWPVLEGVLQ